MVMDMLDIVGDSIHNMGKLALPKDKGNKKVATENLGKIRGSYYVSEKHP